MSSSMHRWLLVGSSARQGGLGQPADDRGLVAGELILVEQVTDFHLDQLEQLGVIDQVDLVEEDDDGRHADLAGEQDVLAGLRHGTVGGRHDQNGAVHLGGAGDHVLDVVGVAGAVDVGVVPLRGFVFDVLDGDRDGLVRVAPVLRIPRPWRSRRTPWPWPCPWRPDHRDGGSQAWSCRGRRARSCRH